MEFDQANNDVSQVLMEITDHPQDWLDHYAQLKAKLTQARTLGVPPAPDLVKLQRQFQSEIYAVSQGR